MRFKKLILNNKYISVCTLIIIAVVMWIVSSSPSIKDVFNSNASKRKLPIYCVETDKKQVSISFDAAWENGKGGTLILLGFRIL